MKKFILSIALICGFMMFASTSTQAQYDIVNTTPCDFQVSITWGKLVSCGVGGTFNVNVPANSTVSVASTVAPYDILYATGGTNGSPAVLTSVFAQNNCPFAIAQGCVPFPTSTTVSGNGCCTGSYTASFFAGFGIVLFN